MVTDACFEVNDGRHSQVAFGIALPLLSSLVLGCVNEEELNEVDDDDDDAIPC